jgi:hypothetical protein
VLVVLTAYPGAPATAGATSGIYVYDALAVTRVGIHHVNAVEPGPAQLSDARKQSASPTQRARGTATTPYDPVVATEAANAAGEAYPSVIHPGTGEPIPYPGEGLAKVPVAERAPWGASERGAYIKEWYDQGYATPEGGWSQYDIHHIVPREYGGTNAFENLVPVERTVHQSQFNTWWRNYS